MATLSYLAAGNIWSSHPVIIVRLEEDASLEPGDIRSLIDAIGPQRQDTLDFPAWREISDAQTPVRVVTILGVLAVLMQRTLYWPTSFSAVGPDAMAVFETRNRKVGRIAARRAVDMVTALTEGRSGAHLQGDVGLAITAFQKRTARMTPAYDALMLAERAEARGISWTSVEDSTFVRLGAGRRSKMLRGSESSDTSLLSKRIAKKKTVTNRLLRDAGIPVPEQRRVNSVRGALQAYLALGRDVVVKPAEGNQGRGVTVRPCTALDVARSFLRAQKVSRTVVIESFVAGDEYRLLVVGGRYRAASQRRPASVVGDGQASISELVARTNADPYRAPVPHGRLAVRLPIVLDAAAKDHLAGQELDVDSVPPAGRRIEITGTSNVSRGGDAIDRTDDIHPDIRELAERAARILGMDLCGIDFITSDPTRSVRDVGGAICEANTQPGLSLHLFVSEGEPRDVAADYLEVLYPPRAPHHVPVVVVATGDETKPSISSIAAAATARGLRLGVVADPATALPDGILRLPSVEAIAWEDRIEAALVAVSGRTIERKGLGLSRADLAILPNGRKSGPARKWVNVLERAAEGRILAANNADLVPRVLATLGAPSLLASPSLGVQSISLSRGSNTRRAVFVGDIGFGEAYRHYPKCRDLQRILDVKGYDYCTSGVRHLISDADITIGNLEVPLAPRVDDRLRGRKKFLGWSEPQKTLLALVRSGFDALSLANNHSLDCGELGLSTTTEQLKVAGITPFGAGRKEEFASQPIVRRITVDGRSRSLVIFAGFESRRRYDKSFQWYATEATGGVARLDPALIASQIATLRTELVDPVFVAFPHWGVDYQEVTDEQKQLAIGLVDAGVDAIIGHGTHACQKIDFVESVPVIYGLGNFVWNTPGSGFAKFGAPPFGLVTELVFGRNDGFGVKLYPIATNNAVTQFRNRPVSETEFAQAVAAILPDGETVRPFGEAGTMHIAFNVDPRASSPGYRGRRRTHCARGVSSSE